MVCVVKLKLVIIVGQSISKPHAKMYLKIFLIALTVIICKTDSESTIKCSQTFDETKSKIGELCFTSHKVQFTEDNHGKLLKFNFPIEQLKNLLDYKTDEKNKELFKD